MQFTFEVPQCLHLKNVMSLQKIQIFSVSDLLTSIGSDLSLMAKPGQSCHPQKMAFKPTEEGSWQWAVCCCSGLFLHLVKSVRILLLILWKQTPTLHLFVSMLSKPLQQCFIQLNNSVLKIQTRKTTKRIHLQQVGHDYHG